MWRGMLAKQLAQLGDARFQRFNFLACPQQYATLYVEFLARHQIEPAQAGAQSVAEIHGDVVARLARAGWDEIGQAPGQFVDGLDIDQKDSPDPMR